MAFDKNTVPNFNIVPATYGDIVISKIDEDSLRFYLHKKGKQLMVLDTRTNREVKELYSSYDLAYGDVLVSGLGFGILPLWLASKPEVISIKVIEFSQEIIDLFLQSNEIPSNLTIELGDISTYVSSDKYNCILLDHFQDHLPESEYHLNLKSIKDISCNVPNHDVIWGWSLEHMFLTRKFEIPSHRFFTNPIDLRQFDLYSKWLEFVREDMDVPTVPSLSRHKLTEYVYTYYNYIVVKELNDYVTSLQDS
jgi:spermidine synthase